MIYNQASMLFWCLIFFACKQSVYEKFYKKVSPHKPPKLRYITKFMMDINHFQI